MVSISPETATNPYLEKSIIKIFHQKLEENPYLHEIKDYFKEEYAGYDDEHLDQPPENIDISKVRISTMTILCDISSDINLDKFYEHFTPYTNEEYGYKLVSIEYMDKPPKGLIKHKKKKQSHANANLVKRRKSFYNQATIIMDYIKPINLKLFRNGSIHITGIIDEEQGKMAVEYLCKEIRSFYDYSIVEDTEDAKEEDVVEDTEGTNEEVVEKKEEVKVQKPTFKNITSKKPEEVKLHNWNIVMINSDFACNFKIRREKLYEILDNKYNLVVNYESDNYPGVKTSFYWNKKNPDNNGICTCNLDKTCSGKGLGTGEPGDTCRKITISIFQSGKIIITGARDTSQINDAYEFITGILKKYYYHVARSL